MKEDGNLIYIPYIIVNRKVYSNASSCGMSVLEYLPEDKKARVEFSEFAKEIFEN